MRTAARVPARLPAGLPVVSAARGSAGETVPALCSAAAVGLRRHGARPAGDGLGRGSDEAHRRALRSLEARLAATLEEPMTARLRLVITLGEAAISRLGLATFEEPATMRLGPITATLEEAATARLGTGLPPAATRIGPLESRPARRPVAQVSRSPRLAWLPFATHTTRPRTVTEAALAALELTPLTPCATELRLVAGSRELASLPEVPWGHRAWRPVVESLDGLMRHALDAVHVGPPIVAPVTPLPAVDDVPGHDATVKNRPAEPSRAEVRLADEDETVEHRHVGCEGRQRRPADEAVRPEPVYPGGSPDGARHPDPPDRQKSPPPVVERPGPGLVGHPGPAVRRPRPGPVDVGRPADRHGRMPDAPVLVVVDPVPVGLEVLLVLLGIRSLIVGSRPGLLVPILLVIVLGVCGEGPTEGQAQHEEEDKETASDGAHGETNTLP